MASTCKRLFLLLQGLSAGTKDKSIQFIQVKVDCQDKIPLVENGICTVDITISEPPREDRYPDQ